MTILPLTPTKVGLTPPLDVTFYDFHPPVEDFRAEVLTGLQQPQKTISPKFLYDKQGAELFDRICELDEYYVTRTEMEILQNCAAEVADLIGDGVLIEFGSGSSQKIRTLLDAAPQLQTYVALDISKQHLYESCLNLVIAYPGLSAIAICADYTQPLQLPDIAALRHKRKMGFFPGSSIGNLEPHEAMQFLNQAATLLEPKGGLLIGVDLDKSAEILEPAYDDAQGVSAAFAFNLLSRMNRELEANFDLNHFSYRAHYNPIGRIEMCLVSRCYQIVHLGDVAIPFCEGETLRTEYSYKYSLSAFQDLARLAGFQPQVVWCDPQNLFSVHYLAISSP
ncbi:L-histidine N(alpha)-methyltransferase [Lyngbya confervoides]|uniref:L-histidine N(Alpha)-methyltransferase n=1 Tax=Lyngbya confervoides BDU141951 TaxID=1574623 RepID=A0ABD4SYR6_9CYAN|nr:L-histidine N(alpha)-methyltransferase [Lyngbya confervoides]MCM1981222.1 L-histidine N(alpha)-methyltransferase [Lyngbya confervoides BDU141951]